MIELDEYKGDKCNHCGNKEKKCIPGIPPTLKYPEGSKVIVTFCRKEVCEPKPKGWTVVFERVRGLLSKAKAG